VLVGAVQAVLGPQAVLDAYDKSTRSGAPAVVALTREVHRTVDRLGWRDQERIARIERPDFDAHAVALEVSQLTQHGILGPDPAQVWHAVDLLTPTAFAAASGAYAEVNAGHNMLADLHAALNSTTRSLTDADGVRADTQRLDALAGGDRTASLALAIQHEAASDPPNGARVVAIMRNLSPEQRADLIVRYPGVTGSSWNAATARLDGPAAAEVRALAADDLAGADAVGLATAGSLSEGVHQTYTRVRAEVEGWARRNGASTAEAESTIERRMAAVDARYDRAHPGGPSLRSQLTARAAAELTNDHAALVADHIHEAGSGVVALDEEMLQPIRDMARDVTRQVHQDARLTLERRAAKEGWGPAERAARWQEILTRLPRLVSDEIARRFDGVAASYDAAHGAGSFRRLVLDNTSGAAHGEAQALVAGHGRLSDVERLRYSVEVNGLDPATFRDVFYGRTAEEARSRMESYRTATGRDLHQEIVDHTEGLVRAELLLLLGGTSTPREQANYHRTLEGVHRATDSCTLATAAFASTEAEHRRAVADQYASALGRLESAEQHFGPDDRRTVELRTQCAELRRQWEQAGGAQADAIQRGVDDVLQVAATGAGIVAGAATGGGGFVVMAGAGAAASAITTVSLRSTLLGARYTRQDLTDDVVAGTTDFAVNLASGGVVRLAPAPARQALVSLATRNLVGRLGVAAAHVAESSISAAAGSAVGAAHHEITAPRAGAVGRVREAAEHGARDGAVLAAGATLLHGATTLRGHQGPDGAPSRPHVGELRPPAVDRLPALATDGPASVRLTVESRRALRETKSFAVLRERFTPIADHPDPTAVHVQRALQHVRVDTVNRVFGRVRREVEAHHPDVRIRMKDLGSVGFGSDRDVTIRAVPRTGRNPDLRSLVTASMDGVQSMYRSLERLGYPAATALDTNFYTELHEPTIHLASAAEVGAVRFDQSVVSLAEARRGMTPDAWRALKLDTTRALSSPGARRIQSAVEAGARARLTTLFDRAEALADSLGPHVPAGAPNPALTARYDSLREVLHRANPPATAREQRWTMAEVKLLEPDAYGSRAAVEGVVDTQQGMARSHSGAAAEHIRGGRVTALGSDGAAHPRLAALAQEGCSSLGKLYEHTILPPEPPATDRTPREPAHAKSVRDGAKYLLRILHAAREAGLQPHSELEHVATAIIEAKSHDTPDQAGALARSDWARERGLTHREPRAVGERFIGEARELGRTLCVRLVALEQVAAAGHDVPPPVRGAGGGHGSGEGGSSERGGTGGRRGGGGDDGGNGGGGNDGGNGWPSRTRTLPGLGPEVVRHTAPAHTELVEPHPAGHHGVGDPMSDPVVTTPVVHDLGPEWREVRRVGGGSESLNVSHLYERRVVAPDGPTRVEQALVKLASEERQSRVMRIVEMKPGEGYRRATAFELVAREAGMDTPEVVIVRLPDGEIGSMQRWLPDGVSGTDHLRDLGIPDVNYWGNQLRYDMDALDYVTHSLDRHTDNFRVLRDPDLPGVARGIRLIDNDGAFLNTTRRFGPYVRLIDGPTLDSTQRAMPPTISRDLFERLTQMRGPRERPILESPLHRELRRVLTEDEAHGTMVRLARVVRYFERRPGRITDEPGAALPPGAPARRPPFRP
jgi:hypothetical protein